MLTEPEFFGGSFTDLSDVADAVDVPVLCKDFVVDPVQLFVARGHGADAVLLMVSVLGDMTRDYADIAETLGLTPLVEVATADEIAIALGVRSAVIAVNSRNLRTLEVDPERRARSSRRAWALRGHARRRERRARRAPTWRRPQRRVRTRFSSARRSCARSSRRTYWRS